MKPAVLGLIMLLALGALGFSLREPATALGTADDAAAKTPAPTSPKVHGMTVSCPTSGVEWGTEAMIETMRELKSLGVNWVAIHPYAHVRKDGSIRGYHMKASDEVPDYVTRPIEEAHRLGMKILMKPHVSYWGSFSWRGDVKFETEEEWRRFFDGYEHWLHLIAEASRAADGFVVGTELEATTHHEARWREIIAGVRERYPGPITYAANWSDYQKVPFWDAVDVVGIQAYFPVLHDTAPEPSLELMRVGWKRIMTEMGELRDQTGKNIVFTELGYNRSLLAPYKPWDHEPERDRVTDAEAVQARCLIAALEAIEAEPRIHGAFLWKWFPPPRTPYDFDKSSRAMRQIIQRIWGGKGESL